MPFTDIAAAKKAKFPTTASDIPLSLAQINHLSRIYDAIQKSGSAENAMAVAWKQWKEIYKKEGDKWVLKKGTNAISEVFTKSRVKNESDWVPIAKVNQTLKLSNLGDMGSSTEGYPTAEGFEMAANLFNDLKLKGYVNRNHSGVLGGVTMTEQKFEDPFLYAKFNKEGEEAIKDPQSNGMSIEATVFALNDKDQITHLLVPGVSVLDGTHQPACTPQMGCASLNIGEHTNSKTDFDLAVQNNIGAIVKIRDVNLYLDHNEMSDDKKVKDQLLAEVSYLGYEVNCMFFEHDENLRMGDVIPSDREALHTIQIAVSETANKLMAAFKETDKKPLEYQGGGMKNMEEDGKGESVTYTGEQTKALIATAIAEVTEKSDNAHAVEIAKLKDAEEAKEKELGVEHEKEVAEAKEEAFKRAQARATFMQKFSVKEDSELVKKYDEAKTVMDMQTLVNSMELPTAAPMGISSAKEGGEEKAKAEVLGAWDPVKGTFEKAYREDE